VNSAATRRFWDLFYDLPEDVRELATKNYHLWRRDPHHPRSVSVDCMEARIASAFEWEIIIGHWANSAATRLFGFGLVPTPNTTGF